jgi:PIN domain nuclease of toxin-antitoxin system
LSHLVGFEGTEECETSRRVFQESERGKHSIVVPIVVLEETARLVEKKVIRLTVSFRHWADELDRSTNFQIQPYTIEILLEAVRLHVIRDPADRVIVATARRLGYPLITADEAIQDGKWVETLWG